MGEGSLDADVGMGNASAMTKMPLIAEDHSQWSLPAAAPAWSRLEGCGVPAQRHLEASSKPISIQMRGRIPAEWRSQFPALNSSLPPPISHPPAKAGAEGRKAPTASDPVTCGQQNLPVPSQPLPLPPLQGDRAEGPPWPSLSIAGSLPAMIE